ncbi:MAG TPA: ABC transporter permease [Acidimicrobiia bacterium]|nr:ABC transporter permease [Acidimicrobiia bacterium]
MARFIALRAAWAIPVLFIVTFLTFWAVKSATDPVQSYLRVNTRATPEMVEVYKEKHGLIGSTPEQYFRWLGNFVTLEWGNSIKGNRPVWPDLKAAMVNSLILGITASIVGITIGLGIGIFSALRQYSKFDTAATGASFVGISMPPFVSAVLLQVFFAILITRWLGLDKPFLPVAGIYPPGQTTFDLGLRAKHMILPVTVVAIQIIAVYSRYMRASLLDVKGSDYMRTARAKGISERKVIMHHAMRNAMIPVVTVAAIDFGAIVGGLIITERIFEFHGTGDYLLTALGNGDFPQIMPLMFVIVSSVIIFNLLADVTYAWLDPRIRLG